MKNVELTKEQREFVDAYLINLNGIEAAVSLGRSREEAREAASRLLRMSQVRDAIAIALVARAQRRFGAVQTLKDMLRRSVPVKRGAKHIIQLIAGRRGYKIEPVARSPAPASRNDKPLPQDVLQAFHHGHCFFCPAHSPISDRILRGHDWDPHLKAVLHEVCDGLDQGTVVEVGANIGASFLTECTALPRIRFVMIEPLPTFFAILKKNVESFGLRNITLHNVAASDGESSDVLIVHDHISGGIAAAGSLHGHQVAAVVPSLSLDELLPSEKITLIKADVDGYELDVFRGGQDVLRRSRPHVLFEYNPFAIEVRGFSPLDLPNYLAGLDIGFFRLFSPEGIFIEATTDPARVWEIFKRLGRPLEHLDVHASPVPAQ
jgi:FkbM family methyltransferase